MAYYNMQETEKRIRQVREILRAKELDAALIYFDELNMGYEYLDYDNDGNKNDVRILVYVNGNEGLNTVVKNCDMTTLGNYVIVSILNDSKIEIKSVDLPVKPVRLEGFKNITISDFQDATGAQMPTGTYSHGVGHNLFGWNGATDFNKVIFSMKVTFGPVDKGYNNALHFGGPYDDWNVMCLYAYGNRRRWCI